MPVFGVHGLRFRIADLDRMAQVERSFPLLQVEHRADSSEIMFLMLIPEIPFSSYSFHLLLLHTVCLLHGVAPASRFHLHRHVIRDFQCHKTDLKVLKEVLGVKCSMFFLGHCLPEESAWLDRFSLVKSLRFIECVLELGLVTCERRFVVL